jgi:hypothetical protein
MAETNNIFDKIQELLGEIPENLTILEEQIDADIQLEYFNFAGTIDENVNSEEVLKNKDLIFKHDLAVEEKKQLLVQLANVDSIEAYRTLEKYLHEPDDILKDWTKLALQESRLLIESKLLDQCQVLISTGLGGKGLKLRYFIVLITKTGDCYTEFEQKIITSELRFSIKRANGELEHISFDKELCSIVVVIPLQIPVQIMFESVIKECNQYGEFLNPDYFITNVRILSNGEIRTMISQNRIKEKNPT